MMILNPKLNLVCVIYVTSVKDLIHIIANDIPSSVILKNCFPKIMTMLTIRSICSRRMTMTEYKTSFLDDKLRFDFLRDKWHVCDM